MATAGETLRDAIQNLAMPTDGNGDPDTDALMASIWDLVIAQVAVPGAIDGMHIAYAGDSEVEIDVGTCTDSTGARTIAITSSPTVDVTASGVNGLDTGSEANSTWYAVYVIAQEDGSSAGLLSTSFTAPTLPSGYVYFRRVGAVRNNSSGAFENFKMFGNGRSRDVIWDDYSGFVLLSNGSATSYTNVDASLGMPPSSRRMFAIRAFDPFSLGNDYRIRIDGASNFHFFGGETTAASHGSGSHRIWTSTNQIFEYQVSSASDNLTIYTAGYIEEL